MAKAPRTQIAVPARRRAPVVTPPEDEVDLTGDDEGDDVDDVDDEDDMDDDVDDENDEQAQEQAQPTGPIVQGGPRPSRRRTIQDVMQEVDDMMLALRRNLAGYHSLKKAYDQFMRTPDAPLHQRLARMPVLTFPASATGRDTNTVVMDLKALDEEHVSHVLVPMVLTLGKNVTLALNEIQQRVAELQGVHQQVLQQSQ